MAPQCGLAGASFFWAEVADRQLALEMTALGFLMPLPFWY